jgi:hypothetical protein
MMAFPSRAAAAPVVQAQPAAAGRRRGRRGVRPFQIVQIHVLGGSSVRLELDVPPCITPPAPPGAWPEADIVAHLDWEVRQLAGRYVTGV